MKEEGKEGDKRDGLTDISCNLQMPRCYGTFPWASRKGEWELGPTRNQKQIPHTTYQTRIRVLCPLEVIRLRPSDQAEALQLDSCVQDQDRRKKGRIGGVEKRKGRGKGKEINKVSCSLPGQGTLASHLCQKETRDKRVPVAASGSGLSAGELVPEYPKWPGCQS